MHNLNRFFFKSILPIVLILLLSLSASAQTAEELVAYNRTLPIESNQIDNWPVGPVVSAQSAILIEARTGTILYAKNIHAKQYPASTTKILTTLIGIEECGLGEEVKFSHAAVFDTPRDSNNIAIDEGEILSVEECLQAILIRSANECAFALAEHVAGGPWQDFGEIMNKRAQELGCTDSHFVNPNGLPDEDHYTSAYDLARIGMAFFSHELLCQYSTQQLLHIYPSAHQKDEIIEANAMQLIKGKKYEYPYLVGCKTGYTVDARSCLVSCAEKNGMRLICVVLRDEAPRQYEDTLALYDYGFENFETLRVSEAETRYSIDSGAIYSGVDVFGSSKPILELDPDDIVVLPRTVTFADLESEISYDTEEDYSVACISYSYHGQPLGTASVNFAGTNLNTYSFEKISASDLEAEKENAENSRRFIFVNVTRIAYIAGAVLCFTAVIVIIAVWHRRYRRIHPNWRRSYRKRQRERFFHQTRLGGYLDRRREYRMRNADIGRRHKRRRRASKFRDYDF